MNILKSLLIIFSILTVIFFSFNHPAKAETYDLKAESLIMDSAKCEVNQLCSFTAKVKNLGSNFNMDFLLKSSVSAANYKTYSPTGISPSLGAMIKTNDYIIFIISGVFSKVGQVDLTFKVDPAGYLFESSTSNNSITLKVNVLGYDLAADSLTIIPAKPMVGQNCYVRISVKNNSSYNLYAGAGTDLIKSFPDFIITKASSTMPTLANVIKTNGYLYYEYEGKFSSAGDKKFSFTIDPNDDLKEADAANNTVNTTISVFAATDADLVIDSVSYNPAKIIMGEQIDITVNIKNIGKVSLTDGIGLLKAEFSYNLPYYDYGINYPALDNYPTSVTPLNPGDIFHYKFQGSFNQPGNFNPTFLINQSKQLVEANYDNDATSTPVVVYKNLAEADSFFILSKSVSFASSTTAIISWKTDVKTTGRLNYNQAHYNVNDYKAEDTASALEHSITLNNLSQGENYIYSLTVKNGTVEKIELISNFIMPADNVLRITAGPSLAVNDKTAVFSWSTNLNSSAKVYYKKKGINLLTSVALETLSTEHRVELKDLAYSLYDYYLSSTSTPKTNVKTDWASFEIKAAASASATTSSVGVKVNETSATSSVAVLTVGDDKLYGQLKGKIILKVEAKGEAYYISPRDKKIYFLGRPEDAFKIIRSQGVGIANADLVKIPVGLSALSGADADKDGLSDAFESAIGTDKNKVDTDGDGFNDKIELGSGNSPLAKVVKMSYDNKFFAGQKGKIFLQAQSRGEAWYVNPTDGKRYFLARPADAFSVMRKLGVGVSNSDFEKMADK